MKLILKLCRVSLLIPISLAPTLLAQETRPWQQVTMPLTRDVAANFKAPPREYGAIQPFQSWNGTDPTEVRQRISRDLDRLSANGIFVINLSPGRRDVAHGEPAYLSPGHMEQVKYTVAELAKRNMRMWIQDESDYPSGFAGGYITERYPQLGMQVIVADIALHVAPGQTLQMPVLPDTLAIWATERGQNDQIMKVVPVPIPADLQLKYEVPSEGSTPNEPHGNWQVQFLRHIYLSSPTRNFNRTDGTRAKNATYSLIDYLDPKATDAFLHTVEETYDGAVGDQFGKTVMGFFGDEPDYSENNTSANIVPGSNGYPWTPGLLAEFKAQKGYDLTPYIPGWFDGEPTPESVRAKADYYDVWSGIFRNSFFGEQADWAKAHKVEYLVHLNHEEAMLSLERSEGDYFRDERYVEVPGIDNLSQLIPSAVHTPDGTWNINNNFPKLASSDAHLFGKPKVWAEEGGGTGIDGKYQLDFQFVRGVNAMQIRLPVARFGQGANDSAPPPPAPPEAAMIAWYTNRGGYLMAIGRPAAQVGLYHPGNTIWLGGDAATEADRSTTKLGWQLFEHQVDWDYFDEQSLSSVATLGNGGFTNLSGQTYKAIVLPSMTVITRTGLSRLREFAKQGGKVIFVGKTPSLVLDKTFMDAKEKPDLSFATLIEPSGDITTAVLAALPKPDVKLDADFPRLTYTHRQWADGDMYYFFNESNKSESRTATIAGHGIAQDWNMASGEIHPISGATASPDGIKIPLVLAPYEAKVIVVGPLPREIAASEPSFATGATVAELTGDWSLTLNGKPMTTELKSWEELGATGFAGPATYHKQFTAQAVPKGKQVYIEIADVHDYAKVTLNGKELGAAGWQPYRWDATGALKKGMNDLVIEVDALAQSGRGGPGGPPPAAAPTAATTASGLATAPPAGAGPAAGARRLSAGVTGAAAGAGVEPPAPTGVGGGGRGGAVVTRATSGLFGSVKLVAY